MPDKTLSDVSGFYDGIFHFYEQANSFLTLGLDTFWRKKAARAALSDEPTLLLDVCCGTGDLTLLLNSLRHPATSVQGLDINDHMLAKARSKAPGIVFTRGAADALPFENDSLDAITVAFAARNLNAGSGTLLTAFREFHRALKPGGCFINLETSQPENACIKAIFHAYAKLATNMVCLAKPGDRAAYSFLGSTICRFYTANELSELLLKAGFTNVEVSRTMLGAIAIHKAYK